MKISRIILILEFVFTSYILFLVPNAVAYDIKYVGVHKCKSCHSKSSMGDNYSKWSKTKHAHSYRTLLSSEAKSLAKKSGIHANPENAMECLICHVTAADAPKDKIRDTYDVKEGVTCEACHGPGSLYRSRRIMKSLRRDFEKTGQIEYKKYEFSHGSKSSCTERCHRAEIVVNNIVYKNPTYKQFDVNSAMNAILHPLPE